MPIYAVDEVCSLLPVPATAAAVLVVLVPVADVLGPFCRDVGRCALVLFSHRSYPIERSLSYTALVVLGQLQRHRGHPALEMWRWRQGATTGNWTQRIDGI